MKTVTLPTALEWKFPLIAIATILVALLSFEFDRRTPPPVWEGRDLIAGLEPQQLTGLQLKEKDKTLTLSRSGSEFVIEELGLAPVDPVKLNELILKLSGARIAQEIGGKADWERYQLSEAPELTLGVRERSGQERRFYFGRATPGQRGRPVRLAEKEEVFLTSEYLWASVNPQDYLLKEVLTLAPTSVTSIERVRDGKIVPVEAALKEKFAPLKVKAYFRTGTSSSELSGINWNEELLLETADARYTFSLGRRGEDGFLRAMASEASARPTPQNPTSGFAVVSVEELAKRGQLERFNQRHMPWVYQLDSSVAQALWPK